MNVSFERTETRMSEATCVKRTLQTPLRTLYALFREWDEMGWHVDDRWTRWKIQEKIV